MSAPALSAMESDEDLDSTTGTGVSLTSTSTQHPTPSRDEDGDLQMSDSDTPAASANAKKKTAARPASTVDLSTLPPTKQARPNTPTSTATAAIMRTTTTTYASSSSSSVSKPPSDIALETAHTALEEWIRAYYADWTQIVPGQDLVQAAQNSAETTLSGAKKCMEAVTTGTRVMTVGAMRSGKSTLLSALVSRTEKVFPAIAANESFSMVPVEMGAAGEGVDFFSVRIQFKSRESWAEVQKKAVNLLFDEWRVDVPVVDLTQECKEYIDLAILDEESEDEEETKEVLEEDPFLAMLDESLREEPSETMQEATTTRTMKENLVEWLRSTRTQSTRIENHPLKSIYSVLDLSPEALDERGISPGSKEDLAAEDSAIELLNALRDMKPNQVFENINQLIYSSSGDSVARFLQLQCPSLKEVNWFLFLFAVDHGSPELRKQLRAQHPTMVQYLNSLPNLSDGLNSLRPYLTPSAGDAVADLWPMISDIVVDVPRGQWHLPLSVHMFDTAGLHQTDQDSDYLKTEFMSNHLVNRLWYTTVSSAIGGGDMMPGIVAVLRTVKTCPVDVIVTKRAESGLEQPAIERKKQAIKDEIEDHQRDLKNVPGHLPGECFFVECGEAVINSPAASNHYHSTTSGLAAIVDHLSKVQSQRQKAAKSALVQALKSRYELIKAAKEMKFAKIDETVIPALIQQVDQFLAGFQGTLMRKLPSSAINIHHTVHEAADDATERSRLLGLVTTVTGALKTHDYRQLGAWLRNPEGEAVKLSWAGHMLKAYFFPHRRLNGILQQLLLSVKNELAEIEKIALDSVTDMLVEFKKGFSVHTVWPQLEAALKDCEKHLRRVVELWHAQRLQQIADQIDSLSQSAGATLMVQLTALFKNNKDNLRKQWKVPNSRIQYQVKDATAH